MALLTFIIVANILRVPRKYTAGVMMSAQIKLWSIWETGAVYLTLCILPFTRLGFGIYKLLENKP